MKSLVFYFMLISFSSIGGVLFPQDLKIINREELDKKAIVEKMTKGEDAKLKNYRTLKFYFEDKLFFCHISMDPRIPNVICH